jgi:hypothetical protein
MLIYALRPQSRLTDIGIRVVAQPGPAKMAPAPAAANMAYDLTAGDVIYDTTA